MNKVKAFLKKELMLTVSAAAAIIAMFITPPSKRLLTDIDWRTLGTLLMMLCVLEGFKQENVLRPLVSLASRLKKMTSVTLFVIFGVFFTSMFVTNDVSLIIFVPLTIMIFRGAGKEKYILPVKRDGGWTGRYGFGCLQQHPQYSASRDPAADPHEAAAERGKSKNQYGFIYGHILDNSHPYLNEF